MELDRRNWDVRRNEALYRIEIVHLIINSFKYYQEVETYKNVMKFSQDYDSCEKAVQMIRILFNQDVKPKELMKTEDELSNDLLDSYKGLKDSLKHFPSVRYPYDKEDILSVLAYLYHNSTWLRMKCYDYSIFMPKVFNVFSGKRQFLYHNVKWLIEQSYEYCFWNGNIKHIDTLMFRATFIKIEKAFNEIIEKRKKRKAQK